MRKDESGEPRRLHAVRLEKHHSKLTAWGGKTADFPNVSPHSKAVLTYVFGKQGWSSWTH